MNSTTTQPVPEFLKDLVPQIIHMFDEATRSAYRMLWKIFMSFVIEHWLAILIVLIIVFLISLAFAIMGSWGMLGSVLYHYLYFGILFIAGLIKGSDIFVSEYFEIFCAIILYPVCYYTVGTILDKTGIHKRSLRR
ncbi:MAG: hypothetical protein A2Z84_01260 [Tenericutes bacterium GWA2_35_7]|nr:MAG: hypothetical protein A2Z84_01260 [Tenericutes bacterium GWA2_35_7]